jgi:subtilisin family serine protease
VILAQAQLSANLQQYMLASSKNKTYKAAVRSKQNNTIYVSALIKITSQLQEQQLLSEGILIGTRAGNIYTLQVPENKISYLAKVKGIDYIQLDEPVTASMDAARKSSHVDSVHAGINLPMAYTGKNVVVGIIDAGFDYTHPTFYDTTGTHLRIKRVWEQKNQGTPPSGFSYGNELTDTSAMIEKGYEVNSFSHGTHVGGIAAGSGYGSLNNSKLRGVAFESDLVFVGIRPEKSEWRTMGMASIIDGVQYIFNYAQSVGKPAVVNLSWGCSIGPNEGSSLFSQALNNLVGPGRIFVLSAGNNGEEKIHLLKQFSSTDTSVSTFITFPTVNGEHHNWIDLWGDSSQSFCANLTLYNADTVTYKLANLCTNNHTIHTMDTFLTGSDGDTLYVTATLVAHEYNGKPHILLDLFNKTADKVNISIGATTGKVHMWQGYVNDYSGYYGSFDKLGKSWAVDGDVEYTLGEMASTQSAITVAAYASKISFKNLQGLSQSYSGYATNNQIVPFSSHGPTVSPWQKPDIAAPGMTLASSVNSYDVSYAQGGGNYGQSVAVFTRNGRNYYYAEASGTSMSSPMVSGIVALMLQVNPGLTPEQIRKIITETAIKDNFTTQTPNPNRWGAGKINAYAAVQKAKLTIGLNESAAELAASIQLYPNPNVGSFELSMEATQSNKLKVTVTNLLGQTIYAEPWMVLEGQNTLPVQLNHTQPGIYLVNIAGEGFQVVRKVVLY